MAHGTAAEREREIARQVQGMLGRSAAFAALPPRERTQIYENTRAIVSTLADGPRHDPYAVPMTTNPGLTGMPGMPGMAAPGPAPRTFTGGATNATPVTPRAGEFGTGIATGVNQAGQLLRQVNFPAFVAELVQGVFQAVVDSSIQQMKAYGELVQSVAMSLNDFRDQNVTENQARDHLVGKYPNVFQINLSSGRPQVGLRPGADEDGLPDFRSELGLSDDIGGLDSESIEQTLVPAARTDLAQSRQKLLATMVLMGINRIVVTDGKINARLKFDFRAADRMQHAATAFDYANMGQTTTTQSDRSEERVQGEGYSENTGWTGTSRSGQGSYFLKDQSQTVTMPTIVVESQSQTSTQAELEASGKLAGEVSLNFRTESIDLTKLVSADQMLGLERARGAGRGAPVPDASAAPPTAAPAPAPAPPRPPLPT